MRAGQADGERLTLMVASADGVVLQDETELAGSTLHLGQPSLLLRQHDKLTLRWVSDTAEWVAEDRPRPGESRSIDQQVASGELGRNSAAEYTVYSKTIPESLIRVGATLRFESMLALTQNSGSNKDVTVRFKLGGVTTATFVLSAIPSHATARMLHVAATVRLVDFLGAAIWSSGRHSLTLSNPGGGEDFARRSASGGNTTDLAGADRVFEVTMQHSVGADALFATRAWGLLDYTEPL